MTYLGRTPKDWIIHAQVYLEFARKKCKYNNQREWDTLNEAVVVLEECLKRLEEK